MEDVRCPSCGRKLFEASATTGGSDAQVEIKCSCRRLVRWQAEDGSVIVVKDMAPQRRA